MAHPGTVVHSTPSALLTGLSGSGKSYSLERILKLTPQVIDHTVFKDRSFPHQQLVWLKLDCPSSPRALCTSFFQAVDQLLGTNYLVNYWGNNGTVGTMVPGLVRVALLHSLGMLVLDEAQNLNAGRAGGTEQLLNFIVELENTLGVPVLMVGNASVMDAFARGFRQLRRGTGLQEPHWFRMTEESKDWEFFTTAMWRYQYLRGKTTLTAEFRGELYYQTQGVADFAVKLYKEVQAFLINSGEDEVITPEVIARVAHVVLFRNALVLKALRERDLSIVKNSTDICIQDICGADLPAEELDRLEKNKVSTEKKSKKKRAKETTPEATPVVAQAA